MSNALVGRVGICFAATFLAVGCVADDEPAVRPAALPIPYDTTQAVVYDPEAFGSLVSPEARVVRLATNMQFLEGPVWMEGDGGHLIFSDVAADEMFRWDATSGVQTFRAPSGPSNGNTVDREGRLVTAQHDGRVTRTEFDGSVTTMVSHFESSRLNSPNDVVVRSDGSIWFTDPTYGLGSREQEVPGRYVYRLDPESGEIRSVVTDMVQPNGLCFSSDERRLYIAETDQNNRHIRVYSVTEEGLVGEGQTFASVEPGTPDGIRCDERGNVWSSAGDGIQIFSPGGVLLARILVPEAPANLAFGGPDGTTVFITARTSLYAVPVLVRDGSPKYPNSRGG